MSNPSLIRPPNAVAVWLAMVLAMIAGIVLVGGLTRLTNSGLSITEWKPISGIIPPLSEADWHAELANYRGTTQYQTVNEGMSLEAFKTIYWWEWGHRLLARTIGLVVLFPLLWFWWRGALRGADAVRGAVLFGLICVQGLVGWLMVVSGLVGRLEVSQYRLAAHLGIAFAIFAWTLWMLLDARRAPQLKAATARALQRSANGSSPPVRLGRRVAKVTEARRPPPPDAHDALTSAGHSLAAVFLGAVFCQVLLGALVAGLDAGLTYNTWPLMDGALMPDGLMIDRPWWSNFGENVTMVQFQHRMMAYAVTILALGVGWSAFATRTARLTASALLAVTLVQVGLGIATLLAGADGIQPVALGALHQLGALCLLASAVAHLHALPGTRNRAFGRASRPVAPAPG